MLSEHCHVCGAPVDPGCALGRCPACLFRQAVEEDSAPAETIGGHDLVEEMARGGMGVVYRAVQREPEREVALKTLLCAGLHSAEAAVRFRQEARTMAELEHPGILPIYQFGRQDGVPWFTMKLAAGGTLARRLTTYAGQWRRMASLMEEVTEAVQFAHGRGVLHRDLKPANILFDEKDHPYVADFGLAKLTEETDSSLTYSAAAMGTPHYMAPEVAEHGVRSASTASDVWSLGVILYELLAQRRPFAADSVPALLREISDREPPALPREVPRDLTVIARKALAREPQRRYGSAREMADDLQRWLDGREIAARPATGLEKLVMWTRRNPGIAALTAALVLATGTFIFIQARSNSRLTASLRAEREQLRTSLVTEARAQLGARRPGQRLEVMEALSRAARIRPGEELRTLAATALTLPDFRIVQSLNIDVPNKEHDQLAVDQSLRRCAQPLSDGRIAIFELPDRKPLRTLPATSHGSAWGFDFSPDGEWLAASYKDHSVGLWSVAEGSLHGEFSPGRSFSGIGFSPDSKSIAVSEGTRGVLIRGVTSTTERRLPLTEPVSSPRWDPSGKRIVLHHGRKLDVWSVESGSLLWSAPMDDEAFEIAWSPGGARMAVSLRAGDILILDAADGRELHRLRGHADVPLWVVWHPEGRWLVSTAYDSTLRIWDTHRGTEALQTTAIVRTLNFSADGTRLLFAPDVSTIAFAEWMPDRVLHSYPRPLTKEPLPFTLAVSENGAHVAAADPVGITLWTGDAAELPHFVPLPSQYWTSLAFGQDNTKLLAGPGSGGVWQLDPAAVAPVAEKIPGCDEIVLQGLEPDGRTWRVRQGDPKEAQLWPDGDRSRAVTVARGHDFTGLIVSADRRWAVSNLWPNGDIRVWDAARASSDRTLGLGRNAEIGGLPNGRVFLTGSDIEYRVWEYGTWSPGPAWPANLAGRSAGLIAVSGDSRRAATLHGLAAFSVRDTRTWREEYFLEPPFPRAAMAAQFSADGRRLWVFTRGHHLFSWQLDELKRELERAGLAAD